MTDEVNVLESEVKNPEVQEKVNETVSPVTPAPEKSIQQEARPEKLYTRDEVAKITNAEKNKALEKAKREFEAATALKNQSYSQPQDNFGQDSSKLTSEQIKQVHQEIENKAHRQAQEMFHQKSISEFQGKIAEAKNKYTDFDDVVTNLGFDKMPEDTLKSMVSLLNVADNGGDVLYDVAKNPTKYAGIINLVAINPNLAIAEIQRLSKSIKDNATATKSPVPNSPLSQVKPSNTGADNGSMTVSDLRKQPWLRG
jgi:hypothetical protein